MFNLKAILCLISVNFFKNEKYVLSLEGDTIMLPSLEITEIDTMNNDIRLYVKDMFLNIRPIDLSRIRFISFNDAKVKSLFNDDKNTIHVHYGGTLPNVETSPEYRWVPFDYMDLKIQKELSIINSTLQHVV